MHSLAPLFTLHAQPILTSTTATLDICINCNVTCTSSSFRDELRRILKLRFTLKLETELFSETLDNFNIRRGSSPKAEIVHWARAAETFGQKKYYLLFILVIRDKRIILKPHTVSIIRAMIVLMIEAVSTSETSLNFYHTTRRNNAENSSLNTVMFVPLSLWEVLLNTVIATDNVVGQRVTYLSEEVPSCHLSNGSYSSNLWSSSTEYYF
jgi:hypothetical protein